MSEKEESIIEKLDIDSEEPSRELTEKELFLAHPDWRNEAVGMGINVMLGQNKGAKKKINVIHEIEERLAMSRDELEAERVEAERIEAERIAALPKPEELVTWEKTLEAIPDGVQTMSKMPARHVAPIYPTYIDKGKGSHVWSGDKEYIDYPCALGPILLGYADERVNNAVKKRLDSGNVFSLPHRLETVLAEKLIKLIPCAEQVRLLKTGTETTMAAIKIARAATGREGIICCGYHGWHGTYGITTDKKKGIPKSYSKLSGQVTYGDKDAMREMFSLSNVVQKEIAAVIMEPYVYDADEEYVKWVIDFAHDNGALVIFDEVVTGFRTKGFSAQAMYGVVPDLTCFGKAMGNGIPISVVCGKAKYMAEIQGDCFVSSTFGGDLLGIAAAIETIDILEKEPVIDHIWAMGTKLKDGFNEMAEDLAPIKLIGLPCRTFFIMPSEMHRTLFWQECIKRGVLLGYAQFINYSHSEEDIDRTLEVFKEALDVLRKNWGEPNKAFDENVVVASATVRHR